MKPRAPKTLAPFAAAALAALLALPAAQAALVTHNFDGVVDTDITNDFAGLTFRAGDPSSGPVRTWAATPAAADTGANVLGVASTFALLQSEANAIDILFDTPVSFVSIRAAFIIVTDFAFGISGLPFMAIYNSDTFSAATRIGFDSWDITGDSCLRGNLCQSGYDTLRWASTAGDIKGIRLSGSAAAMGDLPRRALFDTLSYDVQYDPSYGIGNSGGGGTVPVPGSVALAALALGLLGATGRARRRAAPQHGAVA
jgi:hypothetical protein